VVAYAQYEDGDIFRRVGPEPSSPVMGLLAVRLNMQLPKPLQCGGATNVNQPGEKPVFASRTPARAYIPALSKNAQAVR
jgi:hypothetical protein